MNINSFYLKVALILSIVFGMAIGGTIRQGPSDQTVGLDNTAVFKCNVNKSDDEEVHWLFDGQTLFIDRDIIPYGVSPSDEERFSIIGPTEDDYDLQIKRVTTLDASRRYTCKIQPKGVGGNATEMSAYLEVHRAPPRANPECTADNRMQSQGEQVDFEAGSEVVFACKSYRGNPDVMLTWFNHSDVEHVEDNSDIDSNIDNSSATFLTRYFKRNLSIEDSGKTFSCRSWYDSDVIGNQSGSCDIGPLNILYSPESISLISNGVSQNGKTLVLTCNAKGGNPDIKTYEWSIYPEIPEERMQVNLNTLSIRHINESDNGLVVTCSATNGIRDKLHTNRTIVVEDQLPTTTLQTTTEDSSPSILSYSIAYILIFILAGLIFLLGIVCTILYFVVGRRKSRRNPDVVEIIHPQDHLMSNRWIDAYDTGSIKSFRSEPGYSVYERHGGPDDIELRALKGGRYKSQDNIYRTPYLGESVSPKISPARQRRRDFYYLGKLDDDDGAGGDDQSSHMYYIPGSPDLPMGASELEPAKLYDYDYPSDRHGRGPAIDGHRDNDNSDGNMHIPRDLVRVGSERSGSRYKRPESPNLSRRVSDSPVFRYKHRRQASGGYPQQMLPDSPLATPPSSPARRKPRSAKQQQHAKDDLQFEYQKFDDMVKDIDTKNQSQQTKLITKGDKPREVSDARHRLWLYQQGMNGKYLADYKVQSKDNADYDEDDVFVVLDDHPEKATQKDNRYVDDEGYCSVHGYGTACGCETSAHGEGEASKL